MASLVIATLVVAYFVYTLFRNTPTTKGDRHPLLSYRGAVSIIEWKRQTVTCMRCATKHNLRDIGVLIKGGCFSCANTPRARQT